MPVPPAIMLMWRALWGSPSSVYLQDGRAAGGVRAAVERRVLIRAWVRTAWACKACRSMLGAGVRPLAPGQAAAGHGGAGALVGSDLGPGSGWCVHSLATAQVVHMAQRALDVDGVANRQALEVLAHLACAPPQDRVGSTSGQARACRHGLPRRGSVGLGLAVRRRDARLPAAAPALPAAACWGVRQQLLTALGEARVLVGKVDLHHQLKVAQQVVLGGGGVGAHHQLAVDPAGWGRGGVQGSGV